MNLAWPFSTLRADALSVRLGGRDVVRQASFTLGAGELVALVGPNGAGKTSLLKALAGLLPSSGLLLLDDVSLGSLNAKERAKLLSYLPQGHQLHWPLVARDVVALGRYPHGVTNPARLDPANTAIIDSALARTDAAAFAQRNVLTLSGGERARVMMARVFAVEAPVLLADEPTAALDPRHQLMAMQSLKAEAARGVLVIAATHDLSLAARFADRMLVIHEGRIAADGSPADVFSPALLRDVYGVEAEILKQDESIIVYPTGLSR